MPISRSLFELDINKPRILVIEKICAILRYQFGKSIFNEILMDDRNVEIEFSKNTGKIKNVFYKKQRILTYKPTVGQFNISLHAGKIIKEKTEPPNFRVVILNDVQEFIKDGKSVFSKHVVKMDPNLRPGNEVIVVNEYDEMLAVGKLNIPSILYPSKDLGVAVSVRKGIGK